MTTTAKKLLRFIDSETGPITKITSAPYPGLIRRICWHSSAFLHKRIAGSNGEFKIFNHGSGGGWSAHKEDSQIKAVVEAIERWAFYYHSGSQNAKSAALDIDSTTNGFAALPDIFGNEAVKENAYCEALERWLLDRVWYNGDVFFVDFPLERSWAAGLFGRQMERLHVYITEPICPEFSALSTKKVFFCLALLETDCGGMLPGSACGADLNAVAEHAIVELYSHHLAFEKLKALNPARLDSIIEARLYRFASSKSAGDAVKSRIKVGKGGILKVPEVVFSAAITGPWNPEVNVYRVLLGDTVPFLVDGVDRFLI